MTSHYLHLLHDTLNFGIKRKDRTGTGTRSLFGRSVGFDLSEKFPILTTKRIHLKSVIAELLWFLRGDTNVEFLHKHGVTIWDEWADEHGDLGPIYGYQWRSWPTHFSQSIDQISNVIDQIRENPESRRHIVSAWNVSEIEYMALPPCHVLFQFHVCNGLLYCTLYQRSGDVFLGVPFNIASYALLTMMIAKDCGLGLGVLGMYFGDLHLYENHVEQAKQQLKRKPRSDWRLGLPKMVLNPEVKSVFDYTLEDFELVGYDPHPPIRAEVSV